MNTDPEQINDTHDLESLLAASRPAAPAPPAAFKSALRRRLLETQIPPRRAWLPEINIHHSLLNLAGITALVVLLALAFLFIPKLQPQPAATQPPPQPTDTIAPQPTVTATLPVFPTPTNNPEYYARISMENINQVMPVGSLSKGRIADIAISPDGKLLALAATEGGEVFNAQTLQGVREISDQAYSVAFSPDGSLLAIGSAGRIELIKSLTKSWADIMGESEILEVPIPQVTSLLFSPDSRWLLLYALDGQPYLLEIASMELISIPGLEQPIISAAFSRDSTMLYTYNGELTALTLATRALSQPFLLETTYRQFDLTRTGRCGLENNPAWLAGNKNLLAAACGKQVILFDNRQALAWNDASPEWEKFESSEVLAVSPDGSQVALGINSLSAKMGLVQIWNTADFSQPPLTLAAHREWVRHLAYAPTSKALFTASEIEIKRWDTQTGELTGTIGGFLQASALGFSLDSQNIFVTSGSTLFFSNRVLWEAWDGAYTEEVLALPGGARGVGISPDGSLIASLYHAPNDCQATLWVQQSKKDTPAVEIDLGGDKCVGPVVSKPAFSPDSRLIALGLALSDSQDTRFLVRVYRTDGSLHTELAGFDSYIGNLAYSPDGGWLAATDGSNIRLFQITSAQQFLSYGNLISGIASGRSDALAFSVDGRLLAIPQKGNKIALLDPVSGDVVSSLPASACSVVQQLFFSTAGSSLLAICHNESQDETTVQAWDIQTQTNGYSHLRWGRATLAALSPDGMILAVAFEDGILQLYRATNTVLVRQALAAAYQPEDTTNLPSPDGAWNAAFTVQGCLTVDNWDWTSTRLTLEPANGGKPLVILDILDWCGLGGTHYFLVAWSPNSRYLFYGRGVIPDGWWCFTNRSTFIQVDTTTGTQTTIGPSGPLSPDGARFAWRSSNDIALWSLDNGLEKRLPVPRPNLKTLNLYWSLDGAWLYLLQNEGECPDTFGAGALVRINVASGAGEVVLDSPGRAFLYLEWLSADTLRLTDSEDTPWLFDLTTRQLTRDS